jgi:N-acetylglucosaminyldiphosphoundecaprenol N-acetyl-beta-D-mannosaminyltransferase
MSTSRAKETRLIGEDRQLAEGVFGARRQRPQPPPAQAAHQPPSVGQPRRATNVAPPGVGKRNVLGVLVDAIDYDAAVERVMDAARRRRPLSLTALAVHGVMTGVHDPLYNARLSAIDIVTPDGQPVRWALNILYRAGLRDWVSGPELALRVLGRMAEEGLPVYLYGSTAQTLDRLSASLRQMFPELRIAGVEPSRFAYARPGEQIALATRITQSGARLVLAGLGCPRQEVFVYGMRQLVSLPLLAVGAAFDYHAGRLRPAPLWLQRHGLAWLWRLALEPRRLWRRYLILNTQYLACLAAQKLRLWRPDPPVPAERQPEPFPL